MTITHAQTRKRRRASALAMVAEGRLALREVLQDGHAALRTCPVHRLMEAAPGMGPKKTQRILERNHIWPLAPLESLDDFQCRAIIYDLPESVK